jgi:predicted NBD/HSP70 family sugar kinase
VVSLAGATQDEVRRSNLSAVLRLLHQDGSQTRSHITAVTGLNRSTVGDLVSALAALGLVRERPGDVRGVGRPSLVVEPVAESAVVLALDVRVERTVAALVGLGGEVFGRIERRHTGRDQQSLIDDVTSASRGLLADLPPGASWVGTGVGVPGVIRSSDGLVRFAPNLGWSDVALGDLLRESIGGGCGDVIVRNDADLGVLAEYTRGAARACHTVIYLGGDVGVGGGLIVDGRPLVGAGGYGGEVGHMRVRPEGHTCRCGGSGCWETEIGYPALLRAAGLGPDSDVGIAELRDRALDGDPQATEAFAIVGGWVGLGLVNLINLLNPQCVVLGGHLGAVYDIASEQVLARLDAALPAARELVNVHASHLGDDATLIGAAEVALTALLDDPVRMLTRSAAS